MCVVWSGHGRALVPLQQFDVKCDCQLGTSVCGRAPPSVFAAVRLPAVTVTTGRPTTMMTGRRRLLRVWRLGTSRVRL